MTESKQAFTWFMVMISIVIQSLSFAVSSESLHQYDPTHAKLSHDHQHDRILTEAVDIPNQEKSRSIDGHDPADCHHCGHCTGTHMSWVTETSELHYHDAVSLLDVPYSSVIPHNFISAPYRPPIA
ncbi:hypothetical protein OE749_03015 [Aestuariibacter sp. AA17]|uniref:DUF2946 domain-containing protein n=1 Tax=Fluctibacter corallii TaxID=2984329 RepID=A0ABT3A4Q7_9ALTE|nr:hypothetical protein [Aestuariibacter sp. AA17]MCV2883671.1 hypothetical protein [Aestuariibacter sp. AA17]